METLLHWARGPLFWTALAFMALGLLRHLGILLWEGMRVYRRAGDRALPLGRVARDTLRWLVPVGRLENRALYSATTVVLHAAVLLVPLFLAGHIELWRRGIGLSWPALPNAIATTLTVVGVVAGVAVVVQRLVSRESRSLSRFQDYALPMFIAFVLASGFLVMHPTWNPFGRDGTLLVHALGADLLLFLVPLTKLSHMVLLPFTQLVSELAWHFPPDAGARVAVALGKEKEPV